MRGKQYLNEPEQYAAVYDKGASWVNRIVVIKTLPNGLSLSRYGLSVSSRVGGAVVRNRIKRRLREILRQIKFIPGWDIVLIARPAAVEADYSIMKKSVSRLLIKAKLITAEANSQEIA